MNALVYDIETRCGIPAAKDYAPQEINPVTNEPYLYARDWQDFKGMGVGVLCCWDFLTNRARVFSQENIAEFGELVKQRQIVSGFNIHKFDNQICEAYGVEIPEWKSFDIYREVLIWAGLDPDERTPGGRNLNEFARINLGIQKIANGADAPKMYQRGEWAQSTTYCLDDVAIESSLFHRAIQGKLIDPVTGNVVELRLPEWMG